MTDAVDRAKQAMRERIWEILERTGVPTDDGRDAIPNFVGAEAAAARLADLVEWRRAGTVKANPDPPQLPVRLRALREGRTVFMAVPAMASAEPFFRLAPERLGTDDLRTAANGRTAHLVAPTVPVSGVDPIDVVVCGSLAVDRRGVRLGKGAGYSDIEIAILSQAGLITDRTVVVTTVHAAQLVAEPLPYAEHDVRVHYVVTPQEVVRCAAPPVRAGIAWDRMAPDKIESIPVLKALRGELANDPACEDVRLPQRPS